MDLSNYILVGRFDLPEPTRTAAPANSVLAQEVSAVTYNWQTDTLFVVGDGGTSIVQVSKTGQLIDSMTLATGSSPQGTEFYDPEGLTFIGNGQFVMTEERDRNAVLFTYTADTVLTRADALTVDLGTFVQNIGLEGLSYDPLTGGFIFVKESGPQGIFQTTIDFQNGTASNGSATTDNSIDLFDPAKLGLLDIADVYALSSNANVAISGSDHLLVLSHESGKIVEVDRQGNIISSLTITSDPSNPLSVVAQQHEGLTVDADGNLYIVSENGGGDFDHPQVWVYAPSSEPNQAPTAITLTNQVASIDENTSTAARIKVADVVVTDDGIGANTFSVGGADAAAFEVDSTGLYIKAGTTLDFEAQASYSVTVDVDDTGVGSTPDASTSYTINVNDVVVENAPPKVYISEAAPWSSGNSPVDADWFEVTNGGSAPLDITGWRVDDSSFSFGNSLALNGITTIAPGESVIFMETNSQATVIQFIQTWFGGNAPAGLQIGTYSGSGVGLSTGGDGVALYDGAGQLQAKISFGGSPSGPFASFDNAAGLNGATISTLSEVGVHGAFAAVGDPAEIGSPGSVGRLIISEVAPWSSGNSPVAADWFELTNTSAFDIDITGWKMDDSSGSPAAAVALKDVTTIKAGESVIFIETNSAQTVTDFIDTWFGGTKPAGLQIGTYNGSGVGLGTGGDAVNIYDAANKLQASISFGGSPTGPYTTFDNAAGLNGVNVNVTTASAIGVNGAFAAVNDAAEIGSPGTTVAVVEPNAPPAFISPAAVSVAENTWLAATVAATDADRDALTFALTGGADAGLFSIDGTTGAISFVNAPDFEAPADADNNNVYLIEVTATDARDGTAVQAVAITVSNVAEQGITLNGGNGNSVVVGTVNDDTLDGGNGNDTVSGGNGNDIVDGGNGNDMLDGGEGNNRLSGGNGNDVLIVGNGDNVLDGGNGNDRFEVGSGNNALTGGNGNDVFVFGPAAGNNTITDFGKTDKIAFEGLLADFASIKAAAHQVGADTVIDLDATHTLTLVEVNAATLSAGSFTFG